MAITGTDIAQYFGEGVFPRINTFITTPLDHPEIFWTVLPLLVTAFFIEVYFGRHKTEELGWNTAFANCISLLWVTTALVRFMFEEYGSWVFFTWDPTGKTPTVILILALGMWGLLLAIFNYYHVLPKGISFFISSAIPVNITALLIVIMVIGKVPINGTTMISAAITFIVLAIFLATVEAVVKPSPEAQEYIEEYKEHAVEMQQEREKAFHHRLLLGKHRIKAQWNATISTIKGFFGMGRNN
jgi:hypothetical protein